MTNLQHKLNNDSIDMLPKIREIISKADNFEANQIRCYSLNAMLNNNRSVNNMSDKQKEEYSSELLNVFKHKEWV